MALRTVMTFLVQWAGALLGLALVLPLFARYDRASFLGVTALVGGAGLVTALLFRRELGPLRWVVDYLVAAAALWLGALLLPYFRVSGPGIWLGAGAYALVSWLLASQVRRVLVSRNLGNRQDDEIGP
jgi:FtsH-binding integral membrane protein